MNVVDTIIKDTYTSVSLQKRLRALREYLLHRLFVTQSEKTDSLKGVDLTVTDLEWIYSLGTPFFNEFTKDNVYDKLQSIDQDLKKLPFITLYLAFEPNDEAVRLIGTFLRNQFAYNMLYEPKIDPALIGGVALVWRGVYKDYSVKGLIDQKRDEILTNFKTYLKK